MNTYLDMLQLCAISQTELLQPCIVLQQHGALLIEVYQYRHAWKRSFWENGSVEKAQTFGLLVCRT